MDACINSIMALLFWVHSRASNFWKLPCRCESVLRGTTCNNEAGFCTQLQSGFQIEVEVGAAIGIEIEMKIQKE